jgi:excisionase family DNA binding protein
MTEGTPTEPIFVSVNEAARILDCTAWTVYKLLDSDEIASRYQGRRRKVFLDSVRAYAAGLPTTAPEAAS